MILQIDYREQFFIKLLQVYLQEKIENNVLYNIKINNNDIQFIILNLEVGDYIIIDENIIHLIIERKSVNDLIASIKDNRFREQKKRLLESIKDSSKILYLIENKKSKMFNIDGAIQNLLFKHKFKVLQTENEQDTFDNILLLYKKFNNNEFEIQNENTIVQLIKKKTKINENIFAYQLNTINGVSIKIATELSNKYCNMNNLIIKYNELENEKDKELMLYNSCKIGKALSTKIYKSLH